MKKSIQDTIWFVSIIIVASLIFVFYQDEEFQKLEAGLETPSEDYWSMFAQISKERKYFEEAGAHYRIPVFTKELLDLVGEEVMLSGYYLPYSKLDSVIIISRYPNSSCFFCGEAGIESVAMVELATLGPTYRMDQTLIVKGKLNLNDTDINKLAFVIENAQVEEM